MILYSLNDMAKFLDCSLKTVQRMLERGEMPQPIREEKDKGGRLWRLWDSEHLEEIKKKLQERQKHRPISKVSSILDNNKKKNKPKKLEKTGL